MIFVGIDVSAKTFDMAVCSKGKSLSNMQYTNDAKGIRAASKRWKKKEKVRVCMESTGTYYLDLAIYLEGLSNVEVMVVNPRASKSFAQARMQRSKTDKVDAQMLSEFGQRMKFIPWTPPRPEIMAVRSCARRLAGLTKMRTQAKNQLHALSATETTPTFVIDDVQLTIEQLEKQIVNLKRYALDYIAEDDFLAETLSLLITIPGIAETTAINLMGECLVLPEGMTNRQWVAMAGLDPRHFSSGSSVSRKTRISKAGNRYLRMALYMPALSASYRQENIHAYYEHLIQNNGLKKPQALCAVMRKLLHSIHAMLKKREPFNPEGFYQLPLQAAA